MPRGLMIVKKVQPSVPGEFEAARFGLPNANSDVSTVRLQEMVSEAQAYIATEGVGATLKLRSRVDEDGDFVDEGSTLVATNLPLPVGEWFEIVTLYEYGERGNITVFLNEQLLLTAGGICTEFATSGFQYPRQWTVNNYAASTRPGKFALYVDDLRVWTE